jgi:uncharacterized protein (DUF1697 family)
MTTFVAMLRGVNVGGNSLKMEWLRQACESIGLREVRTYVQSGNIVFASRLGEARLVQAIKTTVDATTRLPVTVVVRSAQQLALVVADNPFVRRKDVDPAKLHVTFLSERPAQPARAKLEALAAARDEYALSGREVYLSCPVNYGETKLSNAALEKALAVTATTRNWKTVTALLAMAAP